MCGRYLLDVPGASIATMLGAIDRTAGFSPNFNVAPTTELPVLGVNPASGERSLLLMKWGLVPAWAAARAADGGKPLPPQINARAETVAEKPMFRNAFLRHRCAVPVSGFYEWHRPEDGQPKTPYLIRQRDVPISLLAGIYESWTDSATGERHLSFAMLTCASNAAVDPIHHRMPVYLNGEDDVEAWLTASADDAPGLLALATACPSEQIESWVVSTRVNSVRNNDATLIEPVAA